MNAASFFSEPLPPAQQKLIALLETLGQEHLFADWEGPGIHEADKRRMLEALLKVDGAYPGGLRGYVENGRKLLAASREGKNPYEGLTPHHPDCVDLSGFGGSYLEQEGRGLEAAKGLVVVLVAGGLGERLGYPGIKIDIPVEVTRSTTYLALYASWILAVSERVKRRIPFVIMTSRDTNQATLESLKRGRYFGLDPSQVHVLMQELVPAIVDNDAHLAKEGPYNLVLKPHGHGDVHMLLHTSGLAARFLKEGRTHLAFIQDTNGQVTNALLAALGVSVAKGFHFNSVAVGRIPGEAVGALTRLKGNGRDFTINVEYNQLDPLLRATISPTGDVPGTNGLSIFPGNINVLLVELKSYAAILARTQGIIAEFVNPKYSDATRSRFNKPTRLETMMQDLPKLFGPEEKTGVTIFDRRWSFSADKNNLAEARAKVAQKGPPESGASAENDFYHAMRFKASQGGMKAGEGPAVEYAGIPFSASARVVFDPSFILTLADARSKIHGGSLDPESTLVVKGERVLLDGVVLKGRAGLVIDCIPEASLEISGLTVEGTGFEQIALTEAELGDPNVAPYLKIRAYRIVEKNPLIVRVTKPGAWSMGRDGKLKSAGSESGTKPPPAKSAARKASVKKKKAGGARGKSSQGKTASKSRTVGAKKIKKTGKGVAKNTRPKPKGKKAKAKKHP